MRSRPLVSLAFGVFSAGLAAGLAARAAPAPAPARPDVPRMIVAGEKLTRTVDCAGADVNVSANDSVVMLKRCKSIRIGGDHDRVSAELTEDSDILVLGDHDVVRWTPAPGYSPYVRDQGRGNVTAPL